MTVAFTKQGLRPQTGPPLLSPSLPPGLWPLAGSLSMAGTSTQEIGDINA